jgi:hypothetical protein
MKIDKIFHTRCDVVAGAKMEEMTAEKRKRRLNSENLCGGGP